MSIFVNPVEGRVRSGWRLLLQLVVMIVLFVVVGLPVSYLPLEGPETGVLAGLIAIPLSVWIAARAFDRRPFAGFGLQRHEGWTKELWEGAAAGAVAMACIWGLQWSAGYVVFDGFGWDRAGGSWISPILGNLLMMMAVGFYEELWSRGYQLKVLAEGLHVGPVSRRSAVAISTVATSAIFGLIHMGNPNASLVSTLNITMAGIMLALPYLLTGRLWVSIGLHASWNFFQGAVFGFPVSGLVIRTSLLQTHQQGPEWFTGGSFGPEAGVVGLMAIVLLCVWIVRRYRPPSFESRIHDFLRPPNDDKPDNTPNTEAQDFVS